MENTINTSNQTPIEWNGQIVITTAQLADAYGSSYTNIKKNFNYHKDNFVEGIHYYLLKGDDLKRFKNYVTDSDIVDKRSPSLYLWTERGANRHCKILDTDKAWEQFDNLEETYFRAKHDDIDRTKLSMQTQLMLTMSETIARTELEQKRQAEKIERLESEAEKQGKSLENIKDTFTQSTNDEELTRWIQRCINRIAESPNFTYSFGNRYAAAKSESYKRLTDKAHCRLDQKVRNAITRAEERGCTKSQINSINKLSIILADRRLREIYITVIKEMMLAYCVEV